MDSYLPPHTPEATAHSHFVENWFDWDATHQHLDEAFVSSCATYQAFDRYLSGADMYIPPRNRVELERILKRYSYDAIHNTIAKARSQVLPGGYGRICDRAEQSIRQVLSTNNNHVVLIAMHSRFPTESTNQHNALGPATPRTIRTK